MRSTINGRFLTNKEKICYEKEILFLYFLNLNITEFRNNREKTHVGPVDWPRGWTGTSGIWQQSSSWGRDGSGLKMRRPEGEQPSAAKARGIDGACQAGMHLSRQNSEQNEENAYLAPLSCRAVHYSLSAQTLPLTSDRLSIRNAAKIVISDKKT